MAVSHGPDAGQVIDGGGRGTVCSSAPHIDVERRCGGELLAVGVVDAEAGVHLQIADVAGDVGFGAQEPAPAAVLSEEHTAHLAEGGSVPLSMKLDGDLFEGRGAAHRAIKAHETGVGEVEFE